MVLNFKLNGLKTFGQLMYNMDIVGSCFEDGFGPAHQIASSFLFD